MKKPTPSTLKEKVRKRRTQGSTDPQALTESQRLADRALDAIHDFHGRISALEKNQEYLATEAQVTELKGKVEVLSGTLTTLHRGLLTLLVALVAGFLATLGRLIIP